MNRRLHAMHHHRQTIHRLVQKLKQIWELVAAVDGPSFCGLNGRFLLRNQRYHERSGCAKGIFAPHEFLSLSASSEADSALKTLLRFKLSRGLEPVNKHAKTIS
jgi:hypothetical protein